MRKYAEEETGVAHAIDDERFFARVGRGLLQEIETNQQIAAQTHAFPAYKEKQEIVGQHQREHGKHEQVQVAEETVVAAFVGHVADGIDVDQEADAGDYQNHHARKRVKQIAPISDERHRTADSGDGTRRDPFEKDLLEDAMPRFERQKGKGGAGGVDEGEEHAAHAEEIDGALSAAGGR